MKQAMTIDRDNLAPSPERSPSLLPTLSDPDRKRLRSLVQDDIIEFPTSLREWSGRWTLDNFLMKLLGITLTAALLSLGAPFWYSALKNLIRLRSLIAQKDDEQRETRQTTKVVEIPGLEQPAKVEGPATN